MTEPSSVESVIERAYQSGSDSLSLANCGLRQLPETIGHLTKLKTLSLANNDLTNVPECITHLTQLQTLDLSGNRLRDIPSPIYSLTQLTHLRLDGNHITELPSIGAFTKLRYLGISHNHLKTLPAHIAGLINLEELDLYNNQLVGVVDEITQLVSLEKLYLGRNGLTQLPEKIGKLKNLRELAFANNRVERVPPSIENLTNLIKLDLGGNQITALPENVGALRSLQLLNIAENRLKILPESLGQLIKLKSMDASNNGLTHLPETIAGLTALVSLKLSNNKISLLPEEMGGLNALMHLDLSKNTFSTLPDSIGNLTSLKQLDLYANYLHSLPSSISNLQNLEKLYLEQNNLQSLPESMAKLGKLNTLDLRKNRLSSLPESPIPIFQYARFIDLSDNLLSEMPEYIGSFKHLRELNVSRNQLQSLPKTLGHLVELEKLDFGENRLATLPSDIGLLVNLRQLDLRGNKLKSLPDSIGQLASLELIQLASNELLTLPSTFFSLSSLKWLNLSDNRLETIPVSIVSLKKLTNILVQGNQLQFPPQRIAEQGIEELVSWFHQESEQEIRKQYHTVVMLLGPENAGKTTLRKKLENIDYLLKDEGRTVGVDIWDWQFPLDIPGPGPESLDTGVARLFDFGGQPLQFLAHHFFMSERAFYVLMKAPEQNDEVTAYWMQCIASMKSKQVIQPFINKKHGKNTHLDTTLYKHHFEFKDTISVDLSSPNRKKLQRSIDELQDNISEHIVANSEITLAYWDDIRTALSELQKPYLSLQEYRAICCQYQLTDEQHQNSLLKDLHRLGHAFHFEGMLAQVVFLDANWLIKALYSLFAPETQLIKNGYFRKQDLLKQWQERDPRIGQRAYTEDERIWLFQILQKEGFGLCYPTPDNDDTYLIPFHLPDEYDDQDWHDVKKQYYPDHSQRCFLGFDFLPGGVTALIAVDLHYLMHNTQGRPTLWRSGMLLHRQGALARIEQRNDTVYGCYLSLEVFGPETARTDLIEVCLGSIKKICDQNYSRLFPMRGQFVPCDGCLATAAPDGYKFRLKDTHKHCPRCGFERPTSEIQQASVIHYNTRIGTMGDTIHATNSIVNSKSTLTRVVQQLGGTTQTEELKTLIEQLMQDLDRYPSLGEDAVTPIVKSVRGIAEEAEEDEPDSDIVKKQSNRLLTAVGKITDIAPKVVDTAEKIIAFSEKLFSAS